MKATLGTVILLGSAFAGAAAPARAQEGEAHALPVDDQCVVCHAELDEELAWPVEHFKTDVHLAAGLSCADCHGGDPTAEDAEESMDPKRGSMHGKLPHNSTDSVCP